MKLKLSFVLIGLFALLNNLQAQYNTSTLINSASNPNSLNTEDDILSQMPGSGWITLYNQSNSNPVWSSIVNIPFDFKFNGSSVSSLKVSNSGILTFSTSASVAPSFINSQLPNADIPDNSVCIWGLKGTKNYAHIGLPASARNPIIRTKTFTNTSLQYRQMWISFTGFSINESDTTKAKITNWAIVLEENTNYIYLVDQSTFSYTTATGGFKPDSLNVRLTLGVQINSTTARSISGSPNIHSYILNSKSGTSQVFTSSDNVYYALMPSGSYYDAGMTKINMGELVAGGTKGVHIKGILTNYGAPINSIKISYSVNNGTAKDTLISGINLLTGESYHYTSALWKAPISSMYNIKIWCSNVNGSNLDKNQINDTINTKVSYMLNPPKKKVLIEEYTGTWCGHCPKGIYAMEYTMKNHPDAIGYALHVGNDTMKCDYSASIPSFYPGGYPSGMVDRMTYSEYGEFRPTMSIPNSTYMTGNPFIDKVQKRLLQPSPVAVNINSTYNSSTRSLTVTVESKFEAACSGDLRINAILIEDSISGGSNFDQANYMAGDITNHPYWGTFPGKIPGFIHRHVVRYNLAGKDNPLGTIGIIPSSVLAGETFSKTYIYTIPDNWDVSQMEIIAFVSKYVSDNLRGEILNTNKAQLGSSTSAESIAFLNNPLSFIVYPNPVNSFATIQVKSNAPQYLTLEIFDMMGKRINTIELHTMSDGGCNYTFSTSDFGSGVYLFKLSSYNNSVTKQIIIQE